MNKNQLKAETLEQTMINYCTGNRNSQLSAAATKSPASLESALTLDQPCGNVSKVLAQWEVTRTEIGIFRQIKTRTRENDYCLCLFEEQGTHRSKETDQKIAIWVCLACEGPALALDHACIRGVTFQASTRLLRITLQEPGSVRSENISWRASYKSETRCDDPTRGELQRVQSIDLYLSRLVDSKAVHELCSKIPACNESPQSSSRLRQYSPQMSPLGIPSPAVSEDTAWLSSGGHTPDHHFSHSFRTEFRSGDARPWSDMQHFRNQDDPMVHNNKYSNCVEGQGQSPEKKIVKQSRPVAESGERKAVLQPQAEEDSNASVSDDRLGCKNYGYYRHQHSHLVRKLQQQVHRQPRSRSRSQTFSSPSSEDSLTHVYQSSERKETVAGHGSAVQQCRTILAHSYVGSDPGPVCLQHGRKCISATEAETTSFIGTQEASVERIDASKDHRRLNWNIRLETSQPSEKTPLTEVDKVGSKEKDAQYRSKRNSLTISTDFSKGQLFDTSMSCASDSGSDRRVSISSSISDISDNLTHSTISCSSSSTSLCSSTIPRKDGPPVHVSITY
ncbi:hypothetical protein BGZ51_002976 [Haplosporangium sp. Z 767]|nr:hypothetical protein BGZ51_002976 [Haplosporangium sp. Z 767]KAF9188647.1 hypothetical protein BGZ50_001226 [Haplosporangium sp. Z 11]